MSKGLLSKLISKQHLLCDDNSIKFFKYRNDPKFSDRQAWANCADPDQTVPRGAV